MAIVELASFDTAGRGNHSSRTSLRMETVLQWIETYSLISGCYTQLPSQPAPHEHQS